MFILLSSWKRRYEQKCFHEQYGNFDKIYLIKAVIWYQKYLLVKKKKIIMLIKVRHWNLAQKVSMSMIFIYLFIYILNNVCWAMTHYKIELKKIISLLL